MATPDAKYADLESPGPGAPSRLPQDEPNPMGSANWLAVGLMFWLDPLIRRGASTTLSEQDVWRLAPEDTSAALHRRFASFWALETALESPRFERALVKTLWARTAWATVMFVVYSAVMLVQPLVVQSLLQFILGKESPILDFSGYTLAAFLTTLSFVSVTLVDFAQAIVAQCGCNAKTLAMEVVFSKALKLPRRSNVSSGDIVTLASVDATRVFDLYIWGPWVVVAPCTLLAIFIILSFKLDWVAGLVGGVVMAGVLIYCFLAAKTVGKLRRELAAVQSERVKLTNELLQGVRVVKLYAWESFVIAKLDEIRATELELLRRFQYNSRLPAATLQASAVAVFALCLLVYVARGHTLTPDVAFSTMAFLGVARLPCTLFCAGVINCSESLASCARLASFLLEAEVEQQPALPPPQPSQPAAPLIQMDDAMFSWEADPSKLTLRHLSFAVESNSLTIVVGPVGSGKSSLLSAILGEIHQVQGTRHVGGKIAYASQDPWIQHASLQDNILFYNPLDEARYNQVVAACQLAPDVAILPQGHATEIGERGINLSGGQKARVSLARAVYRAPQADIFLLDDPLSALDVHVAGGVFRECIQTLLRSKAVVLVLNSHYHLLRHADRILVLDEDGSLVGNGTLDSLKEQFPHLVSLSVPEEVKVDEEAPSPPENDKAAPTTSPALPVASLTAATGPNLSRQKLIAKEERQQGGVSVSTYLTFFQASGWSGVGAAVAIALIFAGSQALLVSADWFLGHWSRSALASSGDRLHSAWIYFALAVCAVVSVFGACLFVVHLCLRCSKSLHASVLNRVLQAAIPTFFDVTPVGRILNRFASDLDQLDNLLPWIGMMQAQYVFQIAAVLLVCGITAPFIVLVYLPLVYVFYHIQRFFNVSTAQLKRMESTTKSPVVNLITEILSGLSTIRAMDMTDTFVLRSRAALDHHQTYFTVHFMASRWLQMRLDWLSAVIITGVSFLVVASKDSIGVTAAGLALTYASQLSSVLSRTVQGHAKLESIMTCAERLHEYESLQAEGSSSTGGENDVQVVQTDLTAWPSAGAISFQAYSMRYRDGLDLVLHDMSFSVRGGEKVGICGRTGSGKSSLVAALCRIVEAASGSIQIDGLDIAAIDLHVLRSRLTVIPQDPVLFSGSLRFNLDPAGAFASSDAELWHVLKQVHLADIGLDFEVAERGSNLSVGQRQLVCIGRALLRQSRIVVLDEATASIDVETDRILQETIRSSFQGVSVLTIAHRLETILDNDRVLVLDAGRVREFDAPQKLLEDPTSAFALLMQQAARGV
ncbi:unnamed protein product [Aphanomyces euteiches]|uniref:Multidrug resistance-associated protein 1 n=1 Tax=Aphanomyces euteiches TaxID=100861 RepID=A0A6G0XFX4_9STRA|nr:hypothetical protein Ae201684_005114 [Aphanomyces euteiches]KAH9080704.1 hypothetical protein Ae201684P_012845 [Aphanomyces euteiches]KAH9144865.1 hypothetical protein AeRB84_011211 [Aphanomyces euteiches]